jgi:hypothetical protein
MANHSTVRATIRLVSALVAILEDNADRVREMKTCLGELLPMAMAVFFDNAHEILAWLPQNLANAILISLDHDLPLRESQGEFIDCGNGRMVADFLAFRPPTCPIIVHSSNEICGSGMFFALKEAGWPVFRVYPFEGQAWIREAWQAQLVQLIRGGWITVE